MRALPSAVCPSTPPSTGPSGSGTCKECDLSWAGDNCHITLPGVIIPTVIVLAVLGTIVFFVGRWYYKRCVCIHVRVECIHSQQRCVPACRMKFRAALASNDWIIDYNDVIIVTDDKGQGSNVFRSMVSVQSEQQNKK